MDSTKSEAIERASYSVSAFCRRHDISKATFYNLRRRGEAPEVFKVGNQPRISWQAEAAWISAHTVRGAA